MKKKNKQKWEEQVNELLDEPNNLKKMILETGYMDTPNCLIKDLDGFIDRVKQLYSKMFNEDKSKEINDDDVIFQMAYFQVSSDVMHLKAKTDPEVNENTFNWEKAQLMSIALHDQIIENILKNDEEHEELDNTITKKLTKKRQGQLKKEAERRVKLWIENSSFDDMTVGGSYLRFNMAVGAIGYPFQPEEWMKPEDTERFVTENEVNSLEFDNIMRDLFNKYYNLSKEETKK